MQTSSTKSLLTMSKNSKESLRHKLMEYRLTQFCNCARESSKENPKRPIKLMLIANAINILAAVQQVVLKELTQLVLSEQPFSINILDSDLVLAN